MKVNNVTMITFQLYVIIIVVIDLIKLLFAVVFLDLQNMGVDNL